MKPIIAIVLALIFFVEPSLAQEQVVANFIKENPDRSSIYLKHNGEVKVDLHSSRKMPLASSVKIIVAIEYAYQVASGTIPSSTLVDTSVLHKYYIPNTDGGAQPAWLALMQKEKKFQNGQVTLEEITKGMINFSSNANTEYLLELLTLDSVNKRVTELGLKQHDSLYYFISALHALTDTELEDLKSMSLTTYTQLANKYHDLVKTDKQPPLNLLNLTFDKQKIWSDNLAGCTTKEYVSILERINSHKYFDTEVQKNIDIVLGGLMKQPHSSKWLKHGGFKGGSTAFVLTQNIYIATLKGETLEVSYFFNDLTLVENAKLQKAMQQFELSLLLNRNNSRDEIIRLLNED